MPRPVAWCNHASLAIPYRVRTLCTVEVCNPSRQAVLAGPQRRSTRRQMILRSGLYGSALPATMRTARAALRPAVLHHARASINRPVGAKMAQTWDMKKTSV